jgi:hypothetical protein
MSLSTSHNKEYFPVVTDCIKEYFPVVTECKGSCYLVGGVLSLSCGALLMIRDTIAGKKTSLKVIDDYERPPKVVFSLNISDALIGIGIECLGKGLKRTLHVIAAVCVYVFWNNIKNQTG